MIKPNDISGFTSRIGALLNDIADTPGARLPGTRRIEARNQARAEGLNVASQYIADIRVARLIRVPKKQKNPANAGVFLFVCNALSERAAYPNLPVLEEFRMYALGW